MACYREMRATRSRDTARWDTAGRCGSRPYPHNGPHRASARPVAQRSVARLANDLRPFRTHTQTGLSRRCLLPLGWVPALSGRGSLAGLVFFGRLPPTAVSPLDPDAI